MSPLAECSSSLHCTALHQREKAEARAVGKGRACGGRCARPEPHRCDVQPRRVPTAAKEEAAAKEEEEAAEVKRVEEREQEREERRQERERERVERDVLRAQVCLRPSRPACMPV